ncbi:NudC domain-containing protein 1 [Sergentomyia squamirostris]
MDFNVLELNVDRNLLKSNFDGYKLSLEPVAVLKNPLQVLPDRVLPSEDQYSYLHAELFSLQNHLYHDVWTNDTSYYFDENWNMRRIHFNLREGRFAPIAAVFRLKRRNRVSGHYNASLIFISEKYAIIGDGISSIEIIDTGDRVKGSEWKKIAEIKVLPDDKVGFILKDARFEIIQEVKIFHCVLLRVEQQEEGFDSVLEWISINLSDQTIKFRRELRSKSSIPYLSLTSNCSGIILASGKQIKFSYDSEKPVEEVQEERKISAYNWKQTDKTVEIMFHGQEDGEDDDFAVSCIDQRIVVKFKNNVLLEGELFGPIDPQGIQLKLIAECVTVKQNTNSKQSHLNLHRELKNYCAKIDKNIFTIILMKESEDGKWLHLIPDSPCELYNELSQEMTRDRREISTLTSQMEEDCDREDNEADYFICRLDGESHKVTHKVNLGGFPPLFPVSLRPGQPAAIALRHDVDCLLWLPMQTRDEWNLRHDGTLDAFAYVLASKQQRKYVSCSPDLSYSVICEPERHVFIYKSTYKSAEGLRKRSGPQITMGQQKVITLEDVGGQVIGMSVLNEITFLLTEKFILCLQINVD